MIRWTKDELGRLVTFLANGQSRAAVAQHYETTEDAIRMALHRYESGLIRDRKRVNMTNEKEIEKIRKLLLEGKTVSDVADEYGVRYGSAYRAVRRVTERFKIKMERGKVKGRVNTPATAVEKPTFDKQAHWQSRHYKGNFDL